MKVDGVIRSIPAMDQKQRKTVRDRATRWAQSGTPQEREAAAQVLDALDDADREDRADLAAHVEGLPAVQRMVEAFQKMPLTESERKLVEAVLDLPGRTSGALTAHLGWEGDAGWHLHFGRMCNLRSHLLGPGPVFDKTGEPFYCGLLYEFDGVTNGFTMKPEAVEAFARLGVPPAKKASA